MNAKPRPSSALFTLVSLVTAVAALHLAREILLPIALAILVSFLLAPLAERLERIGLGRIPSVLSVVTVAFAVLGLLGWVVTSQLVDLSQNMPNHRKNLIDKVKMVAQGSGTLKSVAETIDEVQKEISGNGTTAGKTQAPDPEAGEGKSQDVDAEDDNKEASAEDGGDATDDASSPESELGSSAPPQGDADTPEEPDDNAAVEVKVVSMPPTPLAQVQGWLGPLMAPLTAAGMVVVLVLFMLLQREDQRNRLIRLFGTNNIHATTEALSDIVNRVSRYLRMQFLINAGYGLCVGCGLAAIGLPNAVMFGVMSFSLRFLPYIGPWISAALPVAVSIANTPGWGQAGLVIALFIVLELVVNNVVEPWLYGSSIGVSGMGIIIAAIFWTWVWGAIGLVLAMPLTVCLVVMARYVPALRFITVMLGDQPTLTVEERIYQRMLALDDQEVRELADQELKTSTPAEFYDRVLLPALALAERDRMAGILTDDQEASVQEVARDLVAEIAQKTAAKVDAPSDGEQDAEDNERPASLVSEPAKARVLCLPLRDEADRTAGVMLSQLLDAAGVETVIGALELLTSERVESVAAVDADMVVVSVLPPLPQRDSRLLCRRLRQQYPSLPIVVGYWDGAATSGSLQLLAAKGDGEIVTTLAEAVDRARAIASRTPAAELSAGNAIAAKVVKVVTPPEREAG